MTPDTIPDEKAGETRPDTPRPEHTPVKLSYAGTSAVLPTDAGTTEIALFANLHRDDVHLDGQVKNPLVFREAISALYAVVASDFRYVPRDRTAYAAYMRMRRETASLSVWQAQQAYFSWILRNDPLAFVLPDPIITLHPDQLVFEVFSRDEGTYATLGLNTSAFESTGNSYGTTNVEFNHSLFQGFQQVRSYRRTRLCLSKEIQLPADVPRGETLNKSLNVPDSWLRGFLQVQSSATLPKDSFTLNPIDYYNLLRHLRLHADRKGQRRGLRVELVPGEAPRLVLEPWEVVLPSTAGVYKGKVARVVRVWGRRRLMLTRRLLPFIEQVDVHLSGSGLPSFWVLRGRDFTFTLGLTGFTTTNWSQALGFDLLLPRKTQPSQQLEAILGHLRSVWSASGKDLGKATALKGAALLEALQLGCQQGRLMYDLGTDVYRLRSLTDAPLDLERLEYRNAREKSAHDLLVRRGAVKVVSENRLAGAGLELVGKVVVAEDRREYRPQFLLTEEGVVTRAECTCTFFRKQGLKAGPCVHLIALRLAWAEQEARQKKGAARQTITVETRTFSKRDEQGENVVQLSLLRQWLKIRWGRAGQPMRLQTLRFNTVEEARAAYFRRIDDVDARGFLDATAG